MLDKIETFARETSGKIRKILMVIMTYLFIVSTATFSCFILEEAGQVFIWSTWPAKDAGRWDLVKHGLEGMKKSRQTLEIVNYSFGWLNPFAFVSYRAFAQSVNAYEQSLMANILAKAPEAYLGETIEFEFTATQLTKTREGIRLIGGGIIVWIDSEVRPGRFYIKARVQLKNNRPAIIALEINNL